MNKQDKEKAEKIAQKNKRSFSKEIQDGYSGEISWIDYSTFDECYKSAMEMAEWKDKQFSDRVEMTLCFDCHEFESCDNCPKYQIKKELLKL